MKPDSILCYPVFVRDICLGSIIVARKGHDYYFHANPHSTKPIVFSEAEMEVIAKLSMEGKYTEKYWVKFDSGEIEW